MRRAKTVFIIIDNLTPAGSERLISEFVPRLPREKYDATVIALFAGGVMAERLEAAGIPVHVVGFKRITFPFQFLGLVCRMLFRRVAIAHCFDLGGRTLGTLVAWLAGVPKIIMRWDNAPDVPAGKWRTFERLACRWSTKFEACSHAVAARVPSYYGLPHIKPRTVHNAIALGWHPEETRAARTRLGVTGFANVVGIVAHHRKRKDYPCLIRASQIVLRRFPKTAFVSVGDGPERDNLEKLATRLNVKQNWFFLGIRKDVRSLYGAFDIFALPSRREGFGIVLLEAMWAGVPCVATAVDGVTEVVVHDETGFLFQSGDHVALAEYISRLLRNARERRALGMAGKKRVRTHFTIDRMIEGIEKSYDS